MENVLSVKNLSIRVGQKELINNISFDIKPGEAVLLSGTNGIGKSTILKSILRSENENKKISGNIFYADKGDILQFDAAALQQFRSHIAYIQQRDDYSESGDIRVYEVINDSYRANTGKTLSNSEVNDLIDEWIPKRNGNGRIFDAKSKPAKFSGGEQRLLSVLSIIATRNKTDLMIIDEPLNNLDFVNARNISNMINRVVRENPNMGLLMISHCRIFPFITREIRLTSEGIIDVTDNYVCHSCFGEPDEQGFY